MLFTMALFPDRPLLFRELAFYIIAFPVIQLTSNLLPKRYHRYIYAFGAIIIFYVLILVFPSEFVIYRLLLLFISIAEIVLLAMFVIHFFKKHELEKGRKQLIYFFVYLHLALAIVGFISNLAGRVTLTEIVIFAIFSNIFFGLAIFIGVILLNGLVVAMVDNNRKPRLNVFKLYGEEIKRKTIYLLNALALVFWIGMILKNFLLLNFIYKGIVSILTQKIVLGSTSFSFDTIIIFFIVIYVSIVFSSLLRVILEEDVLKRFSLSKGLPHTIAMMVKYTMIVAGFILAINAAGIPLDKLTIILGAFSVGIGFGLQNIFNNLVSGFILLLERPIQLGDTVQVGLLTGNVKSIGIRSSNILTFDGADVIVPNGQLVSNEVINWTLSDPKRRIEIAVGVSYKSDPALVHQLLSNILNEHPDVLKDPEPLVFFDGLGESSLDFILLYWISDNLENRRIKSEILFRVFSVLKENNIEIPFPQRDIHVRTVNGDVNMINENAVEPKSRRLKS
jgi:small-conductance mechanosensitive channel